MSIKWMSWVWENSPYDGIKLLAHLALADHANDDGVCWPSYDKIALKCRCSRRYAITLIKNIEADGFVTKEARMKSDHIFSSNSYTLKIPSEQASSLRSEQLRSLGVVNSLDHYPSEQASSLKSSMNHHIKPSITRAKKSKSSKSHESIIDESSVIKEKTAQLKDSLAELEKSIIVNEQKLTPDYTQDGEVAAIKEKDAELEEIVADLGKTTAMIKQKNIFRRELIDYFCQLRGLDPPKTDRPHMPSTQKLWYTPVSDIHELCGGDLEAAKGLIRRARDRLDRVWGNCSNLNSLMKTVLAVHADDVLARNKQLAFQEMVDANKSNNQNKSYVEEMLGIVRDEAGFVAGYEGE